MARLTNLLNTYAWALDEARCAMPGADVRLQCLDLGYSVVLGVFEGDRTAVVVLEGVYREERDGRIGTRRLSEFDIRCWICAVSLRGLAKPWWNPLLQE